MDGVTSIEVYGYASKAAQTITAENVTATYGDTGKSVSASVTEPTTGGGAITYAVEEGSGDYIEVNPTTGALTIKKAGTATVVVTAAETGDYAQATKEVTVTINKAAPSYTVPTGLTATYGQTLANVTLPNADNGAWSWNDATTTSVGNVGTNTFKANFTPTDTGNYNSVSNVDVTVTVAKATPTATAPTATATYGETLADVTLTNPAGNTEGTWAWADAGTTSVGAVGDHTFKANFTPTDTANYNAVSNVDVAVTVNKAANPATVASTASVAKGGNTVNLSANVTMNGATGAVSYEISGDAKGCSLNGSVLTSGTNAGSVTVNVSVAEDDNYNALAATPITVTVLNYTALDTTKPLTIGGGTGTGSAPQTGDTLTAGTTATDLEYAWYYANESGEPTGDPISTASTYAPTDSDVGKKIVVKISQTKKSDGTTYADNEKPTQTSAAIGPIKKNLEDENVTVTFTSADPINPRPTFTVSYGETARTVSANDYTVEYSGPTGTPSIVTVTVTPKDGTNYAGTLVKKYTLAPEAKLVFNAGFVNFTSETFADTFTQGGVTYEISKESDFSNTNTVSGGENLLESNESSKTYYIRVAKKDGEDGYPASGATQFTITRPNAPGKALFTVAGATSGSAKDGRITVSDLEIAKQLEYSTDGTSYKEVPETGIITDLDDGNVLIRYEAKTASGVLKSKAQTVNVPITIKTVSLTSVTISGTAKYGETLRAVLTGADGEAPTGTITYEWQRDGVAIPDATDSAYTLAKEDIGHTITLAVAQNGDPAQTAVTPLVTKASGSTAKPTVTASGISKTDTTITVNSPVNGDGKTYEYSIDGGKTWQGSNAFTDLLPTASYTVVVREKGSDTTAPGASSAALTVKTDAEVLTLSSVSIKYPDSTNEVKCGQTLQAIVTQTGSKGSYTSDSGVSYQWLRNGVVISGATGSTYTLTADDVGKKITVKVSKAGSSDITSSEEQAKTVTKALALPAPTVAESSITKTNTTITVNGFKNNTAKSLEYEYSKDGGTTWQDSNVFTGLTGGQQYSVAVRVKGTDARIASEASTAVSITTDANPLPFNEGTQTPAVVIPSYSYGATASTPSLNVEPSTGATVKYYWSRTAFKSSDTATAGTEWTAESAPTEVGTYFVRAVVSGDNYSTFVSGQTALKVEKATKAADTAALALTAVSIHAKTLEVTLGDDASGKKLEYAVIQGSENLADAAWSSIPAGETGFTIDRKLAIGEAKLYVREKADANYEASAPVSATFMPEVYTVSYDLNGGTGSVPDTVKQASGQTVTVDTAAKPTRAGYEFLGWNASASATSALSDTTVSSATTLYAIWGPHTYTVKFDVKDGIAVSDKAGVKYGEEFILPTTTKASSAFAGWSKSSAATTADYTAGQLVKNLAGKDKTADEITLYAVWTEVASVSGVVSSNEGENVTLKLMRGDTQIGDTQTVALDPTGSGYAGTFQFDGVPYGIYNLIIEQVVPTGNGDETETLTKSIMVTVSNIVTPIDSSKLKMPTSARSALQVVGTDTPPAVVDGLDQLAESEAVDERSVTVTMTVEKQEEQTVSQTATEEEKATQEAIEQLKSSADTASGSNGEVKEMDFLNINVTKEVTLNGAVESTEAITDTASIMEIVFPYVKPGSGKIDLWRFHGAAQKFNDKGSRPSTPADLDFYFLDGMIHLFTCHFSTYAVSYTETTSSYSYSSGGSSSSGATYSPTVSKAENGTVNVSPTSPKTGDKVTITAKPDKGYEVDTVTVTDASGKTVEVTKNADGTYSFTQPSGKVKIDVTFKAAQAAPASAAEVFAPYSDLDANGWYADGVRYALENGIMSGYGNGKFAPNDSASRAMIAQILYNLEGKPAYAGASEFYDVDNEQWYGQAVRWASANGIVEGYRDADGKGKMFDPNGAVTREQLVTILYRYAKSKGVDVGGQTSLTGYSDAASVSGWAEDAMQWAVSAGVITGKGGGILDPKGNATRSEIATIMMRYCEDIAK